MRNVINKLTEFDLALMKYSTLKKRNTFNTFYSNNIKVYLHRNYCTFFLEKQTLIRYLS